MPDTSKSESRQSRPAVARPIKDAAQGSPLPVRIEFDLNDAESMRQARAHVDQAVEDTVASITRSRSVIDLRGVSDDAVRLIARRAARLALCMSRNPDRHTAGYEREGS